VHVADDGSLYPLVGQAIPAVIQREERFAKTAVGWVLREISRFDEAWTRRELEKNIAHFSSEGLKNATKHMDKDVKQAYAALWREAAATSR
jgi:3-methyladenine DNA glycosylase AlkD